MLWKRDSQTVSLVVNRAPYPDDDDDAFRRQDYCMSVLKESSPWWVAPHFLDLESDVPGGELKDDSFRHLGEEPPLPSVREMMNWAINQGTAWAGVAVSDLIFTTAAWPAFQEGDYQILVARASQVPNLDEGDRIVATPIKKRNELSLDALFVRGEAKRQFLDDFPGVFLAEYWDDTAQAWARRHRDLGICVLNHHETMHKVHDPAWSEGVTVNDMGTLSDLRPVGIYNLSMLGEFKKARR